MALIKTSVFTYANSLSTPSHYPCHSLCFSRDHLRSPSGIICGPGSFAVRDHLRSWDHLRTRTGLLTDRLNNTRTKNRPTWLTIDGSKPTNDWWQTLHESFSQYHHGYTDQSRSTDQTYNIIDWQTLFTWLWRWLPLRLSKRQSSTTVLFRTTLTRTITLYELLILLGSNHLQLCQ